MLFFYSFLVKIVSSLLPVIGLFSKKIKLFCKGRECVISELRNKISKNDDVVWLHAASLGEYEQGLPIIKKIREKSPAAKVVVSFFSPSGFEVKKDNHQADVLVYLPLDIPEKVKEFLDVLNPIVVIFIKYEFWLNYLHELKRRNIPTYLVSGIFRRNQAFFKWYGGGMRRGLSCFTHFFVQNQESERLLQSIGYKNVTLSGDTRFDRVLEIIKQDNTLPFIEGFKGDSFCMVFGSTWEEDQALFLPFINKSKGMKFIIAPHSINLTGVQDLKNRIKLKTLLYSEMKDNILSDYDVFIIDTIGLLTKIYSYANLAYVGGGMATGLHNTLEPAVFGIPVIIGKEYTKFQEATDLVLLGGVRSVYSAESFQREVSLIINNEELIPKMGKINIQYINQRAGATQKVINSIVLPQ